MVIFIHKSENVVNIKFEHFRKFHRLRRISKYFVYISFFENLNNGSAYSDISSIPFWKVVATSIFCRLYYIWKIILEMLSVFGTFLNFFPSRSFRNTQNTFPLKRILRTDEDLRDTNLAFWTIGRIFPDYSRIE